MKLLCNRPRSIYQYFNKAPRLSGQTSIFGVVSFVSKSLLGIEGQRKLEKIAILPRKPRSHAWILIYRTWPIANVLFSYSSKLFIIEVLCELNRLSNWLDWLTDWMTEWLTDWLTDLLIDWLTDRLIDWLIDWLTDWLSDWLTDWLNYWLTHWLTDWLTDWLPDWLNNRLIDWLAG